MIRWEDPSSKMLVGKDSAYDSAWRMKSSSSSPQVRFVTWATTLHQWAKALSLLA